MKISNKYFYIRTSCKATNYCTPFLFDVSQDCVALRVFKFYALFVWKGKYG